MYGITAHNLKLYINKDAITGERLRKNFKEVHIETGFNNYNKFFINLSTYSTILKNQNCSNPDIDMYLDSNDVVSIRPLFGIKPEKISCYEKELLQSSFEEDLGFRLDTWNNMEQFSSLANMSFDECMCVQGGPRR